MSLSSDPRGSSWRGWGDLLAAVVREDRVQPLPGKRGHRRALFGGENFQLVPYPLGRWNVTGTVPTRLAGPVGAVGRLPIASCNAFERFGLGIWCPSGCKDLSYPLGDVAGFLGGAARRLKFRGRQPERTGVTNGGPVAKGGGADAQPRACQCGAGLVGPWAAGGHPRQNNDGGHAARKRQDLQRLRDRLEVVELRAAGDDDQVGDTSCFQRRVLGPGRRIDDDNVNVVRRGRGDGARQAGGLHSKHKWGFCGAAGAPLAGRSPGNQCRAQRRSGWPVRQRRQG